MELVKLESGGYISLREAELGQNKKKLNNRMTAAGYALGEGLVAGKSLVELADIIAKIRDTSVQAIALNDEQKAECVKRTAFQAEMKELSNLQNPIFVKQEERRSEIASVEAETGEPVLSWREMAILGYSPLQAQRHRKTASRATAKDALSKARAKLKQEGWIVIDADAAAPPVNATTFRNNAYAREIADAQLKSSWGSRTRSTQVYGSVWKGASELNGAKT